MFYPHLSEEKKSLKKIVAVTAAQVTFLLRSNKWEPIKLGVKVPFRGDPGPGLVL